MTTRLTDLPRLHRNLIVVFALLAVENSSRFISWGRSYGEGARVLATVRYCFADSFFWAVASWFLFAMLDRTAAMQRWKALLVAGVTVLTCTLVSIAVNTWLVVTIGPHAGGTWSSLIGVIAVGDFHVTLLWSVLIMAFGRGLQWWHVEESALVRQARLREERLRAELAAVASQLEPHFLFNTLTGVVTLAARDAPKATEMLDGLRALLDYPRLHRGDAVALAEEVRFAGQYLNVQSMRFAERLVVELDIDPQVLDCAVPPLILQPVVENAIRHGIEPLEDGGFISIRGRREGDRLVLTIRNSDAGAVAHVSAGHGLGLSCVRARLQLLFGGRHTFAIQHDEVTSSVTVRLSMPAVRVPVKATVKAA
jgi:two-component system LytT family sensor kinase